MAPMTRQDDQESEDRPDPAEETVDLAIELVVLLLHEGRGCASCHESGPPYWTRTILPVLSSVNTYGTGSASVRACGPRVNTV